MHVINDSTVFYHALLTFLFTKQKMKAQLLQKAVFVQAWYTCLEIWRLKYYTLINKHIGALSFTGRKRKNTQIPYNKEPSVRSGKMNYCVIWMSHQTTINEKRMTVLIKRGGNADTKSVTK